MAKTKIAAEGNVKEVTAALALSDVNIIHAPRRLTQFSLQIESLRAEQRSWRKSLAAAEKAVKEMEVEKRNQDIRSFRLCVSCVQVRYSSAPPANRRHSVVPNSSVAAPGSIERCRMWTSTSP